MIFIDSIIDPNPKEYQYWADLVENPYGGTIKYHDGDDWVYLDEPRFQQSPASRLTEEQLTYIETLFSAGLEGTIQGLQLQIDTLQSSKADVDSVYNKEYIDDSLKLINNTHEADVISLTNSINKVYTDLTTKVEDGDKVLDAKIDSVAAQIGVDVSNVYVKQREGYDLASIKEMERLKTVTNYDDTAIKETIQDLPTKLYVSQYVSNFVVGQAPQVLDTLEELSAALGNDPNFATTITTMIATKADTEDVYTKSEVFNKAEVLAKFTTVNDTVSALDERIDTITVPTKVSQLANDSGFINIELDPTVPNWAKQDTKPAYTAAEVGALPVDTHIPSTTGELTNDAGFITKAVVDQAIEESRIDQEYIDRMMFLESSYTQNITTTPTEDVIIKSNVCNNVLNVDLDIWEEPTPNLDAPAVQIVIQMDAEPSLFRHYYLHVINGGYKLHYDFKVAFHVHNSEDLYTYDLTGVEVATWEIIKIDTNMVSLIYNDTQFNNVARVNNAGITV